MTNTSSTGAPSISTTRSVRPQLMETLESASRASASATARDRRLIIHSRLSQWFAPLVPVSDRSSGQHLVHLNRHLYSWLEQWFAAHVLTRQGDEKPIYFRDKNRCFGAVSRRDFRPNLVMIRVALFNDGRCVCSGDVNPLMRSVEDHMVIKSR